MKAVLILVLAMMCGLTNAAQAIESFDMQLTGVNGQPPHPNVDLYIRKMIAGFVQDMHVKKYVQLEKPAGGGFHVCIDPIDQTGYNRIVSDLQGFSVGGSARWDVSLVPSCADNVRRAVSLSTNRMIESAIHEVRR